MCFLPCVRSFSPLYLLNACMYFNETNYSYSPPQANSAFHPSGVGKWVPASAGKAKAGLVHSVSGWSRAVQVNCEMPWERVPYLSALEVCSRRGAIQIHVYLYLYHQVHMTLATFSRLWIQRSRSDSDDYKNTVNSAAPEPLIGFEPNLHKHFT